MTDPDPVVDLLTRVAAQDRAAFRDLYATTSAKLMGVLVRRAQGPAVGMTLDDSRPLA